MEELARKPEETQEETDEELTDEEESDWEDEYWNHFGQRQSPWGRVVRLNSGKETVEGLAGKPEKTEPRNRFRFFDPELRPVLLQQEVIKEYKRLPKKAAKVKDETKKITQNPESDPQVVETAKFLAEMTEEIVEQSRFNYVCCDDMKYIQHICRLVQEKVCSLPEEVRKKLESVMMSFQMLIAGMWKLLLYCLLFYELTSILTTYQKEESNISKKRGRFKYGFLMASMMALWLAHDVESNPGPSYCIRSCLERIARDLSEVLRYHLPVEGSLWSESVAAAAYAAGYSTDCQWSNPSGNSKDKLTTLIERATELGRVLATLDCLPPEFAPFVNDLGNYVIQEQLVIHYKVKNLRSAVNIVLDIRSLEDEHKQAIIHEIQRLKQIPHFSKTPVDSGRMCNPTDFDRLADSNTSHPTSCDQNQPMRRKLKRVRQRKENGNHFHNLDKSQSSSRPEPVAAVTLVRQMDPGSDGKNDTNIVLNLDETLSTVSKVQDVTAQEDMTTKSLSARKTNKSSTSDENQTFSVGTTGSEPLGSTGDAVSILNEILDSNMTFNQSHDIELDDILVWLDGTETQVQKVIDDDARNTDISTTATKTPGMKRLQKAHENLKFQLTTPPAQNSVLSLSLESDQICQTHDAHTNKHTETERYIRYPLTYNHQIMELQNLIPGQNALCRENNSWSAEGNAEGSDMEESSMNIYPDITESDKGSDSTLPENTGEGSTSIYLERDINNLTQDRAEAEEHRTGDDDSIEHFVQGEQFAKTESETEFLQQAISPQATGSNSGHEADRNEVTSVDGRHKMGAKGDTCENEAETLSSGQVAAAEAETEPIQQTVSPLAAVTNIYPDTDRDEMYREEDKTSGTQENEAEDLTLRIEQYSSTEPADTRKHHMEPTVDEHFAKFKALLIKEFEDRLDAFKATLGNNTPNHHEVQNENGESLDCASSGVEHTKSRVRSSDSLEKGDLTDPENGPTSKKRKQ